MAVSYVSGLDNTTTGPTVDTLTLQQTQGTPGLNPNAAAANGIGLNPNITAGTGINFDTTTGINAQPFATPGVGSANDDNTNGPNTVGVTNVSINQAFNSPIASQPNVLDQYASYTYSLSWYMLTPNQWNEMKDGKVNMNTWMLIMQSGGAQANVSDGQSGGRSPYFTEDYYMDNLILKTNMPGGGRGSMLGSNLGGSLEFTVTEPNGITLQNNLAQAMQDLLTQNGLRPIDFQKTPHCMVIKFYGYDQDGNLVQAGLNGAATSVAGASSTRAVVTKVYPFYITKFSYRLASRIIEYKINANAIPYRINASSQRGTIPEKFELVGKTVGDILEGNGADPTQVFVPDGRIDSATAPGSKNVNPQAPYQATNSVDAINQQTGQTDWTSIGL